MADTTKFRWDSIMALVGPATYPLDIGSGHASGTIAFPTGATTIHTRELIIGSSTDGNIKVTFLNRPSTAVTIPVKSGARLPWAVTKVWTLASGGVNNIWGFY